MNYYEHHLGDWAAATGHLSWDEDMAYTRLLRAYYHHEQAIAEGQQYRLAKASTPAQRRAVNTVLAEFFELRDGRYHQKRADAEIARFQDKQAKAKRSAEARWNAGKAQSAGNANASADAMRTHSDGNAHQTPDTRHQTQTPEETHTYTSTEEGARSSPVSMAGAVCITLRAKGIPMVNPSHPELLALLQSGVDIGAFGAAAEKAVEKGRPTLAYVLGIVKGQIQQAQALAQQAANAPPQAQSRKDRQLETAAGLTGAVRRQQPKPTEVVDVDARVIPS